MWWKLKNKTRLAIVIMAGICLLQAMPGTLRAQTLTLDSCWSMAIRQYPMVKTRDLINKTRDYNIQNAARGYLPQFSVAGQATYQSAVTTVNLPAAFKGFSFPSPYKDQFNVHAEVDQTIYDGGAIHNQKQMEQANATTQQNNLDVTLYALKDRINQLYFGILLINEQLKQNALLQKDIQSKTI
jgi:outer membrane protein TolC